MIQTWKKYEQDALSHSSIHHCLAVHFLRNKYGYARGSDIARYLDISRGSVSITLNKLKHKGYIVEDDNKFYQLTDRGQELVNSVLSKRRITDRFFKSVLQLPDHIAEVDGCKIEHLLSEQTCAKLISLMEYFSSDHKEAEAFRKGFEQFIQESECPEKKRHRWHQLFRAPE
ncbi:metal-dependent transcriptional regulator [candidate division KSB1 bacterium]|nr:metal-dependent transcriptional regulator [candidate division KSB1 bacterium]